jgi:glycosyltransferase involved in cell wall biosynthesis
MSRIAILSSASPSGDAVGNDIRESRRILEGRGHEVEVFTSVWGSGADPRSRTGVSVPRFVRGDRSAVVIYHHTIGWKAGVRLVTGLGCRRVVRYHNVTPARFFEAYDARYTEDCRRGREQLRDLARANCDLYLSASAFNETEFRALGVDPARCAVVPPLHQVARLAAVGPDPQVLRDLGDGLTNLLFVGRLVPHKGHRFLLDAFAAYNHHYNPYSRLVLVGKGDWGLGGYTRGLDEQARRLRVRGQVVFAGGATEAELRAYYECAHAFVVASEHEGFCVPVVEAMALGVPVVGYGTAAVPDTVADAGLIWDEPEPFLLAESIARAVEDGPERAWLRLAGRRRYEEKFALPRLEAQFVRAMAAVAA